MPLSIIPEVWLLEARLVLTFHYFVSRYNNSPLVDLILMASVTLMILRPRVIFKLRQNAIVDHADTSSWPGWLLDVRLMYGMASVF